ncbi:hypothetical protein EMIHUDRAFT_437101, partial [Emiliania huxleyi CCMP1516]|uniref:Uncharacterized protein n=2 Tax=Emiliania huxleyi TaxID=2903 RepID=A0A0D3IQH7_EMIH1
LNQLLINVINSELGIPCSTWALTSASSRAPLSPPAPRAWWRSSRSRRTPRCGGKIARARARRAERRSSRRRSCGTRPRPAARRCCSVWRAPTAWTTLGGTRCAASRTTRRRKARVPSRCDRCHSSSCSTRRSPSSRWIARGRSWRCSPPLTRAHGAA